MRKVLLLLFCCITFVLTAQEEEKTNAGGALLINATYAYQIPGADLVNRFGTSGGIGGGVDYMTGKHNLIFGVEAYYLFGTKVKEDVLANLRGPDGNIIGNNRTFAQVQLRERGFYFGALVGKLISLSKNNKRSGIRISLGMGLLQHKIRVQDDSRSVLQLEGDYLKGYDRLSNGLAFTEFIGYQYLDPNRLINFFAGFEFTQAFTKSRRDFDFLSMSKDEQKRKDFLYAFKVGWSLPFYIGKDPETIFY